MVGPAVAGVILSRGASTWRVTPVTESHDCSPPCTRCPASASSPGTRSRFGPITSRTLTALVERLKHVEVLVPIWERTNVQTPLAERLFRQTLIKRLTSPPQQSAQLATSPWHPTPAAPRHVRLEPLIEPEPDAVQFLGRERRGQRFHGSPGLAQPVPERAGDAAKVAVDRRQQSRAGDISMFLGQR